MRARLLLDARSPAPLSLRFFLTVPLFGMLLGALLLAGGAAPFASRWHPLVLAATHLLTLGVLGMSMAGALWQILPVVCGVALPCPALAARATHLLLSVGGLALSLGFLLAAPAVFAIAGVCLLLAVACLLAGLLWPLLRTRAVQPAEVARGIRLALCCLLAAAIVGGALLLAWIGGLALPLTQLTDLHALLAGPGWVGLLIMAVSFQVLPMFQVTPPFPAWVARWLPVLLALSLVDARASAAVLGLYALLALVLLARRPRPPEASTGFWWLGLLSLLGSLACGWAGAWLAAGICFLLGFGASICCGMLYKIVPFLLWTSWSEAGRPKPVASIRLLLPERGARLQLLLHTAALALLLGGQVRLAGAALLLDFGLLGALLWRAVRR
ncbi:hypothetical protein [Massilia sp. TS11]|uniref:hypothetical protein n=1 Tax=Massilia sp. TS11 TaxID=2908003 RepID=UPI001EDBC55D|nr:hypothetical protein [Massilia sp. TS11]MCG2585934.1 hypothetical protein [Massilia sp. TS11]